MDVLLILQFTVEKNGSDTHVVIIQWAFSDAGSTPAASTINLMEARYTVSPKKTDEGFSVWVPGLPGVLVTEFNKKRSISEYSGRDF